MYCLFTAQNIVHIVTSEDQSPGARCSNCYLDPTASSVTRSVHLRDTVVDFAFKSSASCQPPNCKTMISEHQVSDSALVVDDNDNNEDKDEAFGKVSQRPTVIRNNTRRFVQDENSNDHSLSMYDF